MKKTVPFLLLLLPFNTVSAGSLYDLYQETLQSDPRLSISHSETIVGDARYDQATAKLLPQVNLGGSWTANSREVLATRAKDSYNGEKYNFSIQQKVLDMASWHNRSRYKHLAESSQARQNQTSVDVTVDLLERYMDALAAQDGLELIVAEKKATAKQLELLKSRYDKQLAILTDVLEVEARLDGIKADEIASQARVEIAFENLSELVNRPVIGPIPGLKEAIALDDELASLQDWTDKAVKNNPSLLALHKDMQAAQAGLREAKAGDYPTVNLSLSAQKSDIGFENSQSSRTETYVASLNLNVPIYQGGETSARKTEQRELFNISQQKYDQAYRQTMRSIREAYLNTRSSWSRMKAADKAVTSAEKSYEAQQKGFKYGTVTVVDVLDALREQYSFRRDFRQSQYEFVINWTHLLSYAGTLSEAHIKLIDSWESDTDVLATR